MSQTLPLLVTHSGSFHCDEAFAYVVLRHALGLQAPGQDHRLVRTRDAGLIAQGDYVWDVGLTFDAAANRFDHHQRGAPTRQDGTPFSSAGLVWQQFGEAAVRALGGGEMSAAIAADLDRAVIRRIDEIDNGVAGSREPLDLAALVGDCNLTWDTPAEGRQEAEDAACCAGGWMCCAPASRPMPWWSRPTRPPPIRACWSWSAACPGRTPSSRMNCR
jgi:uncharacterized UPF0160 family protein